MTDSASQEDNRPRVDSAKHDDIGIVWSDLVDALYIAINDDNAEDENLEIIKSACKKALKEIKKIEETKY